MSLLRTSMLRSRALGPCLRVPQPTRIQARFATQDYGSGEGDPAGERPQEQGKNPMSHLEHPGPEAPKVGGGKSSSSSSSSSSQPQKSSGGHTQDERGEKRGARPKILDEGIPEETEDVKKHNEEMKSRYDSPVTHVGGS